MSVYEELPDVILRGEGIIDGAYQLLLAMRFIENILHCLRQLQIATPRLASSHPSLFTEQESTWSESLLANIPFIRERVEVVLQRTKLAQSNV